MHERVAHRVDAGERMAPAGDEEPLGRDETELPDAVGNPEEVDVVVGANPVNLRVLGLEGEAGVPASDEC